MSVPKRFKTKSQKYSKINQNKVCIKLNVLSKISMHCIYTVCSRSKKFQFRV